MLEIVRSGWGVQLHVIFGADDGQVHCLGACKRLACMLNVCHVLGWAQGCFQGENSIAKFASKQKKQESDLKYGQWQVNLLSFDRLACLS